MSRDNSKDPTDYAVICGGRPSCGLQFLTEEQELAGLMNPDAPWRCPKCGDRSEWDDDCRSTNPPTGWRPHTEKPREIPCTAIIAVLDKGDGQPNLLSGVYTFTVHRDSWWDEISGKPITELVFWWRAETELLADLPILPT